MTLRDLHWERFYAQDFVHQPSSFAQYCAPLFGENKKLADAGCGNGRDSHYFASLGHIVTAVDLSEQAIAVVKGYKHRNIIPICADIAGLNGLEVDAVYSRFSLHSVPEETEDKFLTWAAGTLPRNGRLFIEARSDKGLAEGDLIFGNDHYRRLLNYESLATKITELGFNITFSVEDKGLAVYQKEEMVEDPYVVRFVAQKK